MLKAARSRACYGGVFWRFLAGHLVSGLGSTVAPLALAVAVIEGGHGGTGLAVVLVGEYVVFCLVLPLSGIVVDRAARVPGRLGRVLVGAQVWCAGSQAAEAALIVSGRAEVWSLTVAAACGAAGAAVGVPARKRLLPLVVPAAELAGANSVFQACRQGVAVAGPPLAGMLIAVTSPGVAIVWDAVTYLVAGVLFWGVRPKATTGGQRPGRGWQELGEGWAAIRRHRWLTVLTATTSIEAAAFLAAFVLGPLWAAEHLGSGVAWGWISGALAAGTVTGSLLAVRISRTRPHPELVSRPTWLISAGGVALAVPLLVMAAGAPFAAIVVAVAAGGVLSAPGQALRPTLIQRRVAESVQGRVLANVELVGSVLVPVAYGLTGPAADAAGTTTVMGACGLVLATAALAPLLVKDVRRLSPQDGPATP